MEVDGAIIINNSEDPSPTPGTMRWTGTDFEGWNSHRWVSLTGYAVAGSVTDLDGNTYQTTRIGNQEWMTENLRVTKYNDGELIDEITNDGIWGFLTEGAWCWYMNNNNYEQTYGKLYNWWAIDDSNGICPEGWHVPSKSEFDKIGSFYGYAEAAGAMKNTTGWEQPNEGATNISKFSALPGGHRFNSDGTYFYKGESAIFWTRTTVFNGGGVTARYLILRYNNDNFQYSALRKSSGYSCRCLRDE